MVNLVEKDSTYEPNGVFLARISQPQNPGDYDWTSNPGPDSVINALTKIFRDSPKRDNYCVDLSGTDHYFNGSALSLLVMGPYNVLKQRGSIPNLHVILPTKSRRDVLKTTHLDSLVSVHSSIDEFLEALK